MRILINTIAKSALVIGALIWIAPVMNPYFAVGLAVGLIIIIYTEEKKPND